MANDKKIMWLQNVSSKRHADYSSLCVPLGVKSSGLRRLSKHLSKGISSYLDIVKKSNVLSEEL